MRTASDQAGDVGNVGNEDRAHLAGDVREALEVDRAWDCRPAAEDQLRSPTTRQRATSSPNCAELSLRTTM